MIVERGMNVHSSRSMVSIKKIGKSVRVNLHESGVMITVGEDNKIKIKVSDQR